MMLRLSAIVAAAIVAGCLKTPVPVPISATPFSRSSSAGQIYYVSPSGDDDHQGSRDAPWRNPGYGSRRLQPGDTLVILGGNYELSRFDEDILHPPSGTEDAWITIRGETGARPVLAGRDNLLTAIDLSGASYIRLVNLEIAHDPSASGEEAFFRDGIQAIGAPSHHLILQDLYVHHLDEFGLNLQDVSDVLITGSRFEYCGFGAIGGPEGEAGGWQKVRIERSTLAYSGHYYRGGDGSDRPYDRPDGFGIEPSDGPIEIVQTIAAHNYGDGFDSKAAHTTIERSIAANNSCDGVKLWAGGSRVVNTLIYGRGDGDPTETPWSAIVIDSITPGATFEFENVTVDDALGGNYLMHVQYDHPAVAVELTLHNSIFRASGPRSALFVGEATGLHADHNLFYLPQTDVVLHHGETIYASGNIDALGEGNLYGDPRFTSPAWGSDGDYHLVAGSPAIDAGTTGPATDLEGHPRDGAPDIGAYEAVWQTMSGYFPLIVRPAG